MKTFNNSISQVRVFVHRVQNQLKNIVFSTVELCLRFSKFYLLVACLICFVLFLASQISAQSQCCNILNNGDFESGNTSFTSGLPINCNCTSGSFCLGNNFQVKCSGWPNMSGNSGSNFLIVDGHPGSGVDVWIYSTPIVTGVKYCFYFWVASVYSEAFTLGLTVNGALVPGATFTVQQNSPAWTQYSFMWTATGPGNTITIRQMTGGAFRDFGLDDIEFGSPVTANYTYYPNSNCGMTISFANQSTGPAPLTYSWNFDDTNSATNTSSLSNPVHMFTDCGTYNVCLTTTRGMCVDQICKVITASDSIPPKAKCQGIGIVLDSNCQGTVTPSLVDGGSTDNCQIQSISVSPSALTGCGVFPVVLTVTDLCMNSSTCVANVKTIETVPPVITCPSNVSVYVSPPGCSTSVQGIKWISATDNCSIPSVNYMVTGATSTYGINDASGIVFNQGVSTVAYTATDGCNNKATCSFTVNVTCETCCPMGTAQGPNLLTNGDFESGLTADFSSGLAPNPNCGQGHYWVHTNFISFCPGWPPLGAQSGSNFLTIDGTTTPGPTVLWQSSVNLNANTDYCFSFWWASAYPGADQSFPIEFNIVDAFGIPVAGSPSKSITISQTPSAVWQQCVFNFNSGLFNGNQFIALRQLSGGQYRDFGIDNISLNSCTKMGACTCDSNSYEFFYSIGKGPALPKNCGDTLIIPSSNLSIGFSSSFHCLGANCPQPTIDWKLSGPSGFTTMFMSSVPATPSFIIPISTSTFSVNGMYTLTLVGHCGQDTCPCTIYFYQPDTCECDRNLVQNPGFFQGAIAGDLGAPGVSNLWKVASQSPQVVLSDGCCDTVSMQMWGQSNIGESICQQFTFIPGHTYSIEFCARFVNLPGTFFNNIQFGFMATNGCIDPFGCSSCASIGASGPILSTAWVKYILPNWTAPGNSSFDYLNIRAFSNQSLETPFGRIDNICIRDITVIANQDDAVIRNINIFPNPTRDVFTIQLPDIREKNIMLKIINLTGSLLFEKKMDGGKQFQILDVSFLANGIYMLQLVSDNKIIGGAKFVKQ
jgi:PKD repeat protein